MLWGVLWGAHGCFVCGVQGWVFCMWGARVGVAMYSTVPFHPYILCMVVSSPPIVPLTTQYMLDAHQKRASMMEGEMARVQEQVQTERKRRCVLLWLW